MNDCAVASAYHGPKYPDNTIWTRRQSDGRRLKNKHCKCGKNTLPFSKRLFKTKENDITENYLSLVLYK